MIVNRHVGFQRIKWKIYGAFGFVVSLYLFDILFYALLDHYNGEITVDDQILSGATLQSLYRYQWNKGFWFIIPAIFLIVILKFIELISKNGALEQITYKVCRVIYSVGYVLLGGAIIYVVGFLGFEDAMLILEEKTHSNYNIVQPYKLAYWVLFAIGLFKILVAFGTKKITESIQDVILNVKDSPFIKRLFSYGKGDNSNWANVVDLQKSEVSTSGNDIILGRSVIQDDYSPRYIGVSQDNDLHLVTIGMSGSGKSTVSLFPNLAVYEGSVFLFDPKGTVALQTFNRRNEGNSGDIKSMFGMRSFLLDPFQETNGELPYSSFNPIAMINMDDPKKTDYLGLIVDALIILSPNADDTEQHFADLAKNLLKGLVVHVISAYPKECHNLPFVFDLLVDGVDDIDNTNQSSDRLNNLIDEMHINPSYGGLVKQMATLMDRISDKEKGSLMSTTYRTLFWSSTPQMRKQLTGDSCHENLNLHRKTFYYVLPSDKIDDNKRWIRMLANMFIKSEMDFKISGKRTLFIMDEYFKLGGIKSITENYNYLRDYNIRLWLIFQNLPLFKATVGEMWNSVVSASTIQILGVNDDETAQWISKKLGQRRTSIQEKDGKTIDQSVPVMSPNQVMSEFKQKGNLSISFPLNGAPQRLFRINFKPLDFGTAYDFIAPNNDSLKEYFKDW